MNKILISPSKYVQGPNAINDLAKLIKMYGNNALIVGGQRGLSAVEETIKLSFSKENISYVFDIFNGECSNKEIDRIISEAKNKTANVLIGVGGGKALDAVKAASFYTKLPIAIVPTIAATDAPCSALSVIYTEDGVFESYLFLPQNPNLVLVDTSIVAKSPARLLISGMGDALATWFEADACSKSYANNMSGAKSTQAALSLTKLCYDTLLEYGYQALLSLKYKMPTEALERIVEANTLLSGLGFESSGLAAAHAIHNGITVLDETHKAYHGEKVAFGTIAQLCLENREREEIEEVLGFCTEVGLPITLSDIGVKDVTKDKIMRIAEASCKEGETIHNHVFKVTVDMVAGAIALADSMGNAYKSIML